MQLTAAQINHSLMNKLFDLTDKIVFRNWSSCMRRILSGIQIEHFYEELVTFFLQSTLKSDSYLLVEFWYILLVQNMLYTDRKQRLFVLVGL